MPDFHLILLKTGPEVPKQVPMQKFKHKLTTQTCPFQSLFVGGPSFKLKMSPYFWHVVLASQCYLTGTEPVWPRNAWWAECELGFEPAKLRKIRSNEFLWLGGFICSFGWDWVRFVLVGTVLWIESNNHFCGQTKLNSRTIYCSQNREKLAFCYPMAKILGMPFWALKESHLVRISSYVKFVQAHQCVNRLCFDVTAWAGQHSCFENEPVKHWRSAKGLYEYTYINCSTQQSGTICRKFSFTPFTVSVLGSFKVFTIFCCRGKRFLQMHWPTAYSKSKNPSCLHCLCTCMNLLTPLMMFSPTGKLIVFRFSLFFSPSSQSKTIFNACQTSEDRFNVN